MKNFSINTVGRVCKGFCKGRIRIGTYKEDFEMALDFWSLDEYRQQWREGLERLKDHDQSCLITNFEMTRTPMIEWWILYKVGNTIYAQNELVTPNFFESFFARGEFNSQTCYDFIGPRQIVTEDGEKISEWSFEV